MAKANSKPTARKPSERKVYKPHPLAERLPPMLAGDFQGLLESIRARGQLRAVTLYEGKILDGRHRDQACEQLGIPTITEEFTGTEEQAVEFVIANAQGRSWSAEQRAYAAANFHKDISRFRKRGPKVKNGGTRATIRGKSRDYAALRFGISPRLVQSAVTLKRNAPKLFELIGAGKLSVHRAMRSLVRRDKIIDWKRKAAAAPAALRNAYEIRTGDSRVVMGKMEAGSVNLLFGDPPYNINDNYCEYNDNLSEADYLRSMREWIELIPHVLAPNGSAFVMIDSRHADQFGMMLRETGLHRVNSIVWFESFGNYNPNGWTDSYRVIHHYAKDAGKAVFHGDMILIDSDRIIGRDKRAVIEGRVPGNVWGAKEQDRFPRIVDNAAERIPDKIAPNQLPVALVERIVKVASNPGDLVFDPFHGTGTTARAAVANGRRYLGVEIDPVIAKRSRMWIDQYLAKANKATEAKAS